MFKITKSLIKFVHISLLASVTFLSIASAEAKETEMPANGAPQSLAPLDIQNIDVEESFTELSKQLTRLSFNLSKLSHSVTTLHDIQINSKEISTKVQTSIAETNSKLAIVGDDINDMQNNFLQIFLPAISAIIAVAITGLVSFLIQKKQLHHENLRGIDTAMLAAQKIIIQTQMTRREKLYAPLKTLLGSSKRIYDQMCDQLLKDDNKRYFRMKDDKSTSGWSFMQNLPNDEQEPFRLLHCLPDVYRQNLGLDSLIDEIFNIGDQITETIRSSAGYALPDQPNLPDTLV